jgi:stage II sporulation protein D
MAIVAPPEGGTLRVTLASADGAVQHRELAGRLFIALSDGEGVRHRPAAGKTPLFSVQAASFSDLATAEGYAGGLRRHWPDQPITLQTVTLGNGRVVHRVMAGRFSTRVGALSFCSDLIANADADGAFVVDQARREAELDEPHLPRRPLTLHSGRTGLLTGILCVTVAAARDGGITFILDGAPYRGSLEIRGGTAGIVAVNRLPLERYLLGVVPCELGPDKFPLVEALKAQAVAARTYAMKHGGRHRTEGFDLCDTPHCQVYGGAGREQELSSRAVEETAGLAAWHDGELAETLYTSTCGGHTEISSDVFSGPAEPYLHGVPCTVDRTWSPIDIDPGFVRVSAPVTEAESGQDLGFVLAVLGRVGLALEPAGLERPVTATEAAAWIRTVTGRSVSPGGEGGSATRDRLAGMICAALGWDERLPLLYSPADVEDLTGKTGQSALAHLLHQQIFQPLPDGRAGGDRTMSRGRFASALTRLVFHLDTGLLVEGVLQRADGQRLAIRKGKELHSRIVSRQGIALFERRGAVHRPIAADRLRCGDHVRFHTDRSGFIDLLVRLPAMDGAAADRYSPYNRWSIVKTREEIELLLEGNGHRIGELVDLLPLERGATGRLVRLRVVGTERSVTLRGLDIRWNLGTRENLFFIDPMVAGSGANRAYRFTGRGWGHGVGLCQVGAAGLAEAGAGFREILLHYYPGITIAPAGGESH